MKIPGNCPNVQEPFFKTLQVGRLIIFVGSKLSAKFIRHKELLSRINKIPAVLYFPPKVLAQLNQLAVLHGLNPDGLIREAFKGSRALQYGRRIEEMTAPFRTGERELWENDPLYALARATMLHTVDLFDRCVQEPAVLAEEERRAPAEWSFGSPKRDDEPIPWWKVDEPK